MNPLNLLPDSFSKISEKCGKNGASLLLLKVLLYPDLNNETILVIFMSSVKHVFVK